MSSEYEQHSHEHGAVDQNFQHAIANEVYQQRSFDGVRGVEAGFAVPYFYVLSCVDEGVTNTAVVAQLAENGLNPDDLPAQTIKIAGSGILNPQVLHRFVKAFPDKSRLLIASHGSCGAATAVTPEGQESNDVAASFVAESAQELGIANAGQVAIEKMDRPATFHDANVVYVEGTDRFNPLAIPGAPKGFGINQLVFGNDTEAMQKELGVIAGIIFGDHGYGTRIDEEHPILMVAVQDYHYQDLGALALENAKAAAETINNEKRSELVTVTTLVRPRETLWQAPERYADA